MHIQSRRNELLQALQAVIGVVDRRQSLPILGNVLLKVADDRLTVRATDLEIELQSESTVQNLAPGVVTAPARKLYDICRSLPEGAEIELKLADKRLTLKSGRSRFALSTMAAEEFPSFPESPAEVDIELPGKQLKNLIQRTVFAMGHQDVRYYLNGLLLELNGTRLRAVATDGHRLALAEMTLDKPVAKTQQFIVPRKAVLELQRLLDTGGEAVQISAGNGQIEVRMDGIRLASKLIDGRFPDYERVIPDHPERIATGDTERMKSALSRAAILSNEKFRGVRLNFSKDQVRIQSQNPEQEEAEEELELEYDSTELEIGFNVTYLLDALSALETTQFVLEMRGPDGSGLLKEQGGSPHRYVVMPMRL